MGKQRTSINITAETAARRQRLISKIFDHKVSADVAENKLLDIAEKEVKSGKRV